MRNVLTALAVLAAIFLQTAVQAGAEEEQRWDVSMGISEGEPDSPRVERLKKSPRHLFIRHGLLKEELIKILLENPGRRIVSDDGQGNITSYTLRDLQWEREQERWNEVEAQGYLVLPPPAGYRASVALGGNVRRQGESFEFDARKRAAQELFIEKGGRCHVNVYFLEQPIRKE